ncbi:DUF2339 domain-containing protein [Numidum massiliense]|uniref:DUF2339 domain-containing protein n=1 Tax=Numidum massiliense TaxID=1522315 RepID=UPI0006D5324C|nr:DUF2339 domain-containing protein [Numidum massiliense]
MSESDRIANIEKQLSAIRQDQAEIVNAIKGLEQFVRAAVAQGKSSGAVPNRSIPLSSPGQQSPVDAVRGQPVVPPHRHADDTHPIPPHGQAGDARDGHPTPPHRQPGDARHRHPAPPPRERPGDVMYGHPKQPSHERPVDNRDGKQVVPPGGQPHDPRREQPIVPPQGKLAEHQGQQPVKPGQQLAQQRQHPAQPSKRDERHVAATGQQVQHMQKREQQPVQQEPPQAVQQRQQAMQQVSSTAQQTGRAQQTQRVTQQKDKPKQNWEQRIGGIWLNRIGAFAVVVGLAFFLKYSIDQNWIGPVGRVLIGIFTGLAMNGLGEKLGKRYPLYAQGLFGGGSLALFFSVYAAYNFYGFISPPFAFIFFVFIMAFTVFMAIRHDALPIGILGIVGGYTTPFLIGGLQNQGLLFGYLILLTLGVLAVSIYKKWASFVHLSFVFNQLIIFVVYAADFLFVFWRERGPIGSLLTFVTVIYALYWLIASGYNFLRKKNASLGDIVLSVANPAMFVVWAMSLFDSSPFLSDYKGVFAAFFGLTYIVFARLAARLLPKDKRLRETFYGIAIVLFTIAPPLHFGAWLAKLFSFLTAGTLASLIVCMYKKRRDLVILSAYITFVVNYYAFFAVRSWITFHNRLDLGTMFSFLVVIFAAYTVSVTGYGIYKQKTPVSKEVVVFSIFNAFAFVFGSTLLLGETFMAGNKGIWIALWAVFYGYLAYSCHTRLPQDKQHFYALGGTALTFLTVSIPMQFDGAVIGIGWAIEAVALLLILYKIADRYLANSALGILALAMLTAFTYLVELYRESRFFLNEPTFLWLVASVALYVFSKGLERAKANVYADLKVDIVFLLRGVLLFFIFIGLSFQNNHFFTLKTFKALVSPEQLTLSVIWLTYAFILFVLGVRKRLNYLRYVALALFALVIVKAFLVDLSSVDTVLKIALFSLLGGCLLIVSFVYQKKNDSL